MKSVFIREMKLNLNQLLIWSFTVGGLGLACILMYQSMQGDMKEMAEMFSNMGAFSDAFGMSTLSIATLKGFFATEVGTVHGLGGGLFAAIIAIGIIAKEEERHSGEFLLSLPVSRTKVITAKGLSVLVMLAVFTFVCAAMYALGFVLLGEEIPVGEFTVFMLRQLLMDIELAGICFFISGLSGKINMGAGMGIVLILYAFDLIGRVVPDAKEYLFIGPYSYANASEIFADGDVPAKAIVVACVVVCLAVGATYYCYNKRDLAS
ncbi:MAG: ABC transporter permease [Lachnospiraceae bacterium]|nr:ABC transporter permease [Lachnospiraceae bacterium]